MSTYRVVNAAGETVRLGQHDDDRTARAWAERTEQGSRLQGWVGGEAGHWSTVFTRDPVEGS